MDPTVPRTPPADTERRELRPFALAAMIAWILFTVKHVVVGGRPLTVGMNLTVIVLMLILLAIARVRPSATPILLHALAAICTVAMVTSAWNTGGPRALTWWYLSAIPLLVMHVGGRRAGLAWWAIACVAAALAIANPLDIPPEYIPTDSDRAFGAIALCTTATALAWLARKAVEDRVAELSAAARAKSELLATISHELRTPLHGILGVASVLESTGLSAEQRELVTALVSSGKTLKRTVDDVLDDARLAVGKLSIEPEPVDLLAALEDVVDLHAADAAEKGITLTLSIATPDGFAVRADEARVRQIVSNLVGNAIKFTSRGTVALVASAHERDDRTDVEIAVEDSGPGIPADRIDRLFTAYDQLDATHSRLHGGTGLGLALSRSLAIQMGGSLEVERGRSVGARFVVKLPLPSLGPSAKTERRGSVLVVEPDPVYANAVRSLARALPDVELLIASSLDEAEALARSRAVDAVVVTAGPNGNPSDAHRRLASATAPGTPLVLALAANAESLRATSAPFGATTLRPLRRSRLRALLDEAKPRASAAPTPNRARALVVDDDPTNRRILAAFLSELGWTPVAIASGAEALALLDAQRFDAVVCDLHMPGMDGVAFVRAARARAHPSYFVAATASVRTEERSLCLSAGFDAFLRKPFEVADVAAVLAPAIRRARGEPTPVPTREDLVDEPKWRATCVLLGDEIDETLSEHQAVVAAHIETMQRRSTDATAVARAAHAVASGSLMLGMRAVGEAAGALELQADALDAAQRSARAAELARLLELSMKQLRAPATRAV